MRTLLSLQEGKVCTEVAQNWEFFYNEFIRVYNLPKETVDERTARMTALRDLQLPDELTMDFFSKFCDWRVSGFYI